MMIEHVSCCTHHSTHRFLTTIATYPLIRSFLCFFPYLALLDLLLFLFEKCFCFHERKKKLIWILLIGRFGPWHTQMVFLPFSLFSRPPHTQAHHVKTDSAVFRLHTNATVILLVTFSIAVTTRQYVGNPIDCVHTRWVDPSFLLSNSNAISIRWRKTGCGALSSGKLRFVTTMNTKLSQNVSQLTWKLTAENTQTLSRQKKSFWATFHIESFSFPIVEPRDSIQFSLWVLFTVSLIRIVLLIRCDVSVLFSHFAEIYPKTY